MAFSDQNEIKKVISIDTGDSLTILRDYKIIIDELKAKLAALDESSDEYNATLDKLNKTESTLNNLMSTSKDKVEAANEAYEEIINSTQKLEDQLSNINKAAQKFDIHSKIDTAADSVKKLSDETSNSSGVFESLGDTSTNVFKNSIDSAIEKTIGGVDNLTGGLGTTIKTMYETGKASLKAGKDMATAEAMATGGLTLIIDAVILLIAYWDDIASIGSKAWDWIKDLVGVQNDYTDAVYDSETAWANMNNQITTANSNLQFQLRLMRAQGAGAQAIYTKQAEVYKQQLIGLMKMRAEAQKSGNWDDEQEKKFQEQRNKIVSDVRKAREDMIYDDIKQTEAEKKEQGKREKNLSSHHSKVSKAHKDHRDSEEERRKKEVENILDRLHKANTNELDLLKEKYDKENKLLEDAGKETLQLTEEYNKKRQEIIDKQNKEALEKQTKQFDEIEKGLKRQRQIELDNLKIKSNESESSESKDQPKENDILSDIFGDGEEDKEILALQKKQEALTATFEVEKQYYNDLFALREEELSHFIGTEEQKRQKQQELDDAIREFSVKESQYNKDKADNEQKIEESNQKKREALQKKRIETAKNVYATLGDLMGENAEFQKLYNIMETTMSTLTGAIDAYKSLAGIPIVGPGLGAAAAAVITAAGIANIKKISQTTKDNAESVMSSGASLPTPNLSMTSVTPLLDETNDVNRMTSLNEQGESTREQQNLRVYVVDQDIRDANNKAEVVESNATF